MALNRRAAALVLAAVLGLPAAPRAEAPVMVFAAASLRTALDGIAAEWTAATGATVAFSYAASPALARQIESGAPADIFASADLRWMDHVEAQGLLAPGTRRNLIGNDLVLIAPAASDAALTPAPGFPLAAALGDGRLAMGAPDSVPAGTYAREALTALGVWDAVAPKMAGAENVRAALALVARGEAPLGVVYRSDAEAEPSVRVVAAFPAGSHAEIVYPFALTAASTNPDAAAFLDHLASPAARAVFAAQGFTALP
jgi:molybdate transport system substrate-binding protein